MMQTHFFKHITLLVMLISITSQSFGQFQGPSPADRTYTVKEIKDNASRLDRSDALVKVQGFITKQIDSETYEFKDNTGTIMVEIDRKDLPESPFDENTELILIGEVDNDLFEPVEIEAKEIRFVVSENSGGR